MKKFLTAITCFTLLYSCGIPSIRDSQEPTSFPYKQEEVLISNTKSKVQLAGTLTLPSNGKVSKIVILITGGGPQNRNYEWLNHRPFLVLSDWLTRKGVAVLRYDDRGVGKSTGIFSTATTFDFADDVEAAITYIRSRHDLENLSIGLIGHSEGGLIAPMVASHDENVKFIVLLAGPGIPGDEITLQQSAHRSHLAGASDADINKTKAFNRKVFDLIMRSSSLSSRQLKDQVDTLLYRTTLGHHVDNAKFVTVKKQYESFVTPWVRTYLKLNPADYLVKVKCPVLALNGTKDVQVISEANLAGIAKALDQGGNKQYKVVPLEGINHALQKAKTGNETEYTQISETINPIVLTTVSNWINTLSL
jgi:pimeloyl-ACP methyl ester carboxylesterase